MKKRIYLSGPITGMKDGNRSAFKHAQEFYEILGNEVDNPHEICDTLKIIEAAGNQKAPEEKSFMAYDILHLSDCDKVAVLPGFENSKGATFEIAFASEYGIPVVEAYTNKPLEISVHFNMKYRYAKEDEEDLVIEPIEITNEKA